MATLLVCGIGGGMSRSASALVEMGHEILAVSTRNDPTLRETALDVLVTNLDEASPDDVVDWLAGRAVHGVLTLGADVPELVAGVASRLGLPGVSEEVAHRCTRKDLRIAVLAEAGLPVPGFALAHDLATATDFAERVGYPVLVKPLDRSGSTGVAEVGSAQDLPRLFAAADEASPTPGVLLEQRLVGTEHTVGGLMLDRKFHLTGFSDRDYRRKTEFYPHYFESGDTFPSILDLGQRTVVVDHVEASALALGLDDCVVNTDILRTDDGTVYVLEITCRLAGSRIATEVLPLGTGVDPLPHVVALATGGRVNPAQLAPRFQRPVVQRFLPSRPGTVRSVGHVPAELPAGVYDVDILLDLQPGYRLPSYRDADDVIAGAIAWGDSVAEAETRAMAALDGIPLVVDWD